MTNNMEEFLRSNRRRNCLRFVAWMLAIVFITCFSIGTMLVLVDAVVKVTFGV